MNKLHDHFDAVAASPFAAAALALAAVAISYYA